jgi:hypothetical protein
LRGGDGQEKTYELLAASASLPYCQDTPFVTMRVREVPTIAVNYFTDPGMKTEDSRSRGHST